jgi:hypothetical protein
MMNNVYTVMIFCYNLSNVARYILIASVKIVFFKCDSDFLVKYTMQFL